MQKRNLKILGLALLILGIILLVNSYTAITGFTISNETAKATVSILGIIFVLAGILLFESGRTSKEGRGLEVKVYETHRGRNKYIEATGMDDIAPYLQVNNNKPVDAAHINLEDLKELTGPETISKKEREEIARKYEGSLKHRMYIGFKDYFKNREKKKELSKEERQKLARELRVSRAAERIIDIIDPSYDTRRESLTELKKAHMNEPQIYNPIKSGKAVYVHYTSGEGLKKMNEEGRIGEENKQFQALFFPDYASAMEFIENASQGLVRSITGASSAEKAVIFQTVIVPKKMNMLVGKKSRSMPKAFFDDMELDACYLLKEYDVPR
jgi:hypothetical protein